MRLEVTNYEDRSNVWLTDYELEDLERVASSQRDYLIICLGGRVGLRAFDIPQICPKHVTRTDDGEHY